MVLKRISQAVGLLTFSEGEMKNRKKQKNYVVHLASLFRPTDPVVSGVLEGTSYLRPFRIPLAMRPRTCSTPEKDQPFQLANS